MWMKHERELSSERQRACWGLCGVWGALIWPRGGWSGQDGSQARLGWGLGRAGPARVTKEGGEAGTVGAKEDGGAVGLSSGGGDGTNTAIQLLLRTRRACTERARES